MTEIIKMECKNCGANLDADSDQEIMYCPYCGAKQIIIKSDAVEVQKIKSKTEKEVELAKIEKEAEHKKRTDERTDREIAKKEGKEYRKSLLSKITLVLAVFFALIALALLDDGNKLGGFLAVLQCIALILSWLFGANIIREKRHNLHLLLFGVAIILVPIITFMGPDGPSAGKTKYVWPSSPLAQELPVCTEGKIDWVNEYDGNLSIRVEKIDGQQFENYLKECKDKGFVVDAFHEGYDYRAFNSKGYQLKLRWYSDSLDIDLEKPIEFESFEWPSGKLAELVPAPDSTKSKIDADDENHFKVFVGEMDKEKFNEYIDKCVEAGFDVDGKKNTDYEGKDYYEAKNADGCTLTVKYEGFNVICINLSEPSKEEKTTSNSQESDTKKADNKNTEAVDGVRPEFKEFWDSYEAYMDEYVEFMKAYDSSNPVMVVEYVKLMGKYDDFMKKADAYEDDDDLSDAELSYMLEVQNRVNSKLLSVATEG